MENKLERRKRRNLNHLNKYKPPNIIKTPITCLAFIFSFMNSTVITNNINIFKFIIDTDLLGLSEFLNELNIHGSIMIKTINNLNTIKNISL